MPLLALSPSVARAQDSTGADEVYEWFNNYDYVLSARLVSARDTTIAVEHKTHRAVIYVAHPLTQWKGHLPASIRFIKIVWGDEPESIPRRFGTTVFLYLGSPDGGFYPAGDRSRPLEQATADTAYASAHRHQ